MKGNRHSAFTLIELLSVMAIMVMMAVIAVTSYWGATRGAAMRGAVSHLQDSLLLARQTAIMNRKAAYMFFAEGSERDSYVVCLRHGKRRAESMSPDELLVDQYASQEGLVEDSIVYNLDSGESSVITSVQEDPPFLKAVTAEGIWSGTCSYGWEASSTNFLPLGFSIHDEELGGFPDRVVFNPDGTTRMSGYHLKLREPAGAQGHGEVLVAGLTGFVSSKIVSGN